MSSGGTPNQTRQVSVAAFSIVDLDEIRRTNLWAAVGFAVFGALLALGGLYAIATFRTLSNPDLLFEEVAPLLMAVLSWSLASYFLAARALLDDGRVRTAGVDSLGIHLEIFPLNKYVLNRSNRWIARGGVIPYAFVKVQTPNLLTWNMWNVMLWRLPSSDGERRAEFGLQPKRMDSDSDQFVTSTVIGKERRISNKPAAGAQVALSRGDPIDVMWWAQSGGARVWATESSLSADGQQAVRANLDADSVLGRRVMRGYSQTSYLLPSAPDRNTFALWLKRDA